MENAGSNVFLSLLYQTHAHIAHTYLYVQCLSKEEN